MAQALLTIGAGIFLILGSIHLIYTFRSNHFAARDPVVTNAMKKTSPVLTKETTIWKAWVGFNASHSLGAIFFALIYIPLALFHLELLESSNWFAWLPVAAGISYLGLAKNYWFRIPLIGIMVATICFIVAAVLLS